MKRLHDVMTQRKTDLAITGGSGNLALLDSTKVLSRLNRRLYRQGRTYRLKLSMEKPITSSTEDITYEVYTLRPTWMTVTTWRKAFEAYLNAHHDEEKLAGKHVARWRDFRTDCLGQSIPVLTMDAMTAIVNAAGNVNGNTLNVGEHNSSDVETETTSGSKVQKRFCWCPQPADLAFTYDVCSEAESNAHTPSSPNDVEVADLNDVPYADLSSHMDDLSSAELQNVVSEGNDPPYDPERWLSTGMFQRVATLGVATLSAGTDSEVVRSRLDTGFFDAPLGFVLIRDVTSSDQGLFTVTFAKGDYKGVLSHSLGKPIRTLSAAKKYRVVDA